MIAVVPVWPTGGCTTAHGNHELGFRHLGVEPLDTAGHLNRHRAGDNHHIGLTRRSAESARPKTIEVIARRTRGHHFNGTAGKTKGHGPERRQTRPAKEFSNAQGLHEARCTIVPSPSSEF